MNGDLDMSRRAVSQLAAGLLVGTLCFLDAARAGAPPVTIGYQPMVSDGLAAKHPFEAWFVLDKSADPSVPGYAIPAGAMVRLTFPAEFSPIRGSPHLEGALLYGWPHGAIPVPFSVVQDSREPHVVLVRIDREITASPPDRPGLKAIHVRTAELNPDRAGDYTIGIDFVDAGPLSGTRTAVVHITEKPAPNIAAYNQLHQGRDEDWQHLKPGGDAPLPIDFLVTLPDQSRSSITLARETDGELAILSDGKSIGSIWSNGVPITLTPEPFGPGFARLGIVRVSAKAGDQAGSAEIIASLDGGTKYRMKLIVDPE
jgi:hypothetical protein